MSEEPYRAGTAHFGSPVRKAARTLFIAIPVLIAGAATAVPVLGHDLGVVLAFVLGMLATVAFVAAMVLVNMQPMASPARVAAERAWSTSLPFAMDGYLDLLALDACSELHILIDVEWAPGRPVEVSLVQGAAGALDVDARAEAMRGGGIRIRSGPLPGTYVDFRRNRQGSNRQHVAYMHALIDRVLLPVHRRNCPRTPSIPSRDTLSPRKPAISLARDQARPLLLLTSPSTIASR